MELNIFAAFGFIWTLNLFLPILHITLGSEERCPRQCSCIGNQANCMRKRKYLSYIPKLPLHINYLQFRGNLLHNITRDTFRNVTRNGLHTLIMAENQVTWVSPDALIDLTQLNVLKLGYEPLVNASQTENLLRHIPLQVRHLAFWAMQWQSLPKLDALGSSNVSSLNFHKNLLRDLKGSDFRNLTNLRSLDVSYNGIEKVSFEGLEQITELNLAGNWFTEIPSFCAIPQLEMLHLENTKITYIPQNAFPCLTNLKYLNLNGHSLRRLSNYTFAHLSIHTLYLQRLGDQLNYIEPYAFESTTLSNLYLTKSYFEFSRKSVDLGNIFAHSPNLSVLDLSFNDFAMNGTDFLTMVGPIKKLQELHLAGAGFYYLPPAFAENLRFLRVLNLSKNHITSWDGEKVFKNSSSVQVLDLSDNQIAIVNKTTFPETILSRLKSLILSNNPFSCSCHDIKWFLEWVNSEKGRNILKLKASSNEYKCLTPKTLDGENLSDLTYSKICPIDPKLIRVIIACASVFGASIVFMIALWKCRWNIRHLMFSVDQRRKRRMRQDGYSCISTCTDYLYDCLPVYADEDFKFVKDKLIPILEEEHGRRLCVRDRDYELGKIFVDNIIDSIDSSRRIMLLLSNNFARSRWCEFQLSIALYRMLEEKSNLLVVVLLQEIEYKCLTSAMKTLIITSDYIVWSEDTSAERMFWEQVRAKVPCTRKSYVIVEHEEDEDP